MPIYEYEVILPDGEGGERFEVLQKMGDPPLTEHPDTGDPVRRVITAASIAGHFSEMKSAGRLSDKNLERQGFTKYVKTGDGQYEKRVGSGPRRISRDDTG